MPKADEVIAGKIRLIQEIGSGGQGSVWSGIDYTDEIQLLSNVTDIFHPSAKTKGGKAYVTRNIIEQVLRKKNPPNDINCVIKFLNRRGPEAKIRFNDEFKASVMLNDRSIVKVIDYDTDDKTKPGVGPWIHMEYLPGGNLKNTIKERSEPFSPSEALVLFRRIVRGVYIAHKNDPVIIHRDLKPENILFRDEQTPVISDFGLCLILEEDRETITGASEDVGPRHFMAPELEGSFKTKATPASDIYSLGKVLYYMISAGVIVTREDHESINYDLRNSHDFSPQVEYIYDHLFKYSIQRKPEDRFQSCTDLLESIEKLVILTGEHYYPVKEGRKCIVCGEGVYSRKPWIPNKKIGHKMICNKCGNIQYFLDPNR